MHNYPLWYYKAIKYQHPKYVCEDGLNTSKSLREYYISGKYKGYYKLRERQYKLSGKVHMTFTNGKKELFAVGKFKEEALKNIFNQIDISEEAANSSSASETSDQNLHLL